ncbi:hypothetical protein G5714_018381 [Onychostoma macrolepis]|uniref:C-type lectin domain-containing protein n=1 Tax=Onychostoma macrolepis TaxID=369639 RepID=A0A7J6C0R3_9TELE|nr:hypothetical protein G5714_018381 [Onychostoma macrolepis]
MREGQEPQEVKLRTSTPLLQSRQREREKTPYKEEPRIERRGARNYKEEEKTGEPLTYHHLSRMLEELEDCHKHQTSACGGVENYQEKEPEEATEGRVTPTDSIQEALDDMEERCNRTRESLKQAVNMTREEYDQAVKSLRQEMDELLNNSQTKQPHPSSHDHVQQKQVKQVAGSDSVQIRSFRAAAVCLLLLCVLLLTAVIVLCVHIHTNNTEETHQLLTKINNLTEQRDLLLTKYINMTNERDGLLIKNGNLTKQRDQFNQERNQLQRILNETDLWLHSNLNFYYISSLKRSWTESRSYCKERGADLIIINNREKQDFVTKITNKEEFWIGVTDSEEEGRWKWVDGTSVISGFWASSETIKEPNGGRLENCAVTYLKKNPELMGWHDVICDNAYQWICEKSTWP